MVFREQISKEKFEKNYPEINVDEILQIDPTYNPKTSEVGQYSEWIQRQFIRGIPLIDLKKVINQYHFLFNNKQITNNLDYYKTYDLLKKELELYKNVEKEMGIKQTKQLQYGTNYQDIIKKGEAIFIYEDSDWEVYTPLTMDQQIVLGKRTKWCISQADRKENAFNQYRIYGPFLIFMNKKTNEKVQIILSFQNENQQWDETDVRYNKVLLLYEKRELIEPIMNIRNNISMILSQLEPHDEEKYKDIFSKYEQTQLYKNQIEIKNNKDLLDLSISDYKIYIPTPNQLPELYKDSFRHMNLNTISYFPLIIERGGRHIYIVYSKLESIMGTPEIQIKSEVFRDRIIVNFDDKENYRSYLKIYSKDNSAYLQEGNQIFKNSLFYMGVKQLIEKFDGSFLFDNVLTKEKISIFHFLYYTSELLINWEVLSVMERIKLEFKRWDLLLGGGYLSNTFEEVIDFKWVNDDIISWISNDEEIKDQQRKLNSEFTDIIDKEGFKRDYFKNLKKETKTIFKNLLKL